MSFQFKCFDAAICIICERVLLNSLFTLIMCVCVLCIMFDVAVICSLKFMNIFDQQDSRVK